MQIGLDPRKLAECRLLPHGVILVILQHPPYHLQLHEPSFRTPEVQWPMTIGGPGERMHTTWPETALEEDMAGT